jgi:hypothetical protein
MATVVGDVRFRGKSGHSEVRRQCLLMTQSGHRSRTRETLILRKGKGRAARDEHATHGQQLIVDA